MIPAIDSEVKLDKYELLEEIGHGGMATVYRARDRRLGREVAVKVIHRHLRENPEVAKRFVSEAKAVAKLRHPNIVEVFDVSGDDETERYLVVELVPGLTVRQQLAELSPFPPEIGACIGVEVCRALCQAHKNGVIHRDIKPENVLLKVGPGDSAVDTTPRVKLTDFGIAKLLDAQGVTHTGQVLGSPAHMSPEQIEGGDVDGRADVFGVGVLLYEMMTGSLPFEGQNPAQVLRRVLDGSFLPPERVCPQVGALYGRIVSRALSRSATDRHATARELCHALEQELEASGVTDPRAEISRFLAAPAVYVERHRREIVERVSHRATVARDAGDVFLAAACFNRALAYRPDDTLLLAEVAGLARRGRLRRKLIRASAVFGILTGGALAAFLAAQFWPKSATKPAPRKKPGVAVVTAPAAERPPRALPPPEITLEEPEAELVPVEKQIEVEKARPRPALAKPEVARPEGVRAVRTPVVGPQNARVRIDGELVSWFQAHELSIGPHTFEFVPPNSECCEAAPPTTVEVVPGEGPQIVRGVIRFRPAILRLSGAPGSHASCGIGEVIPAGGSREIPMNRPVRELSCTLVPAPGIDDEPRRVEVALRPGRTFTLTGL